MGRFLDRLRSKRVIHFIVIVLLVAAVPLTVFIAQKQQEIRQRASGNDTLSVSASPASVNQGETLAVSWNIPTHSAIGVSPSSVGIGEKITIGWSGVINPLEGDWITFYKSTANSNSNYSSWVYENCTNQKPVTAVSEGKCDFTIPAGFTPGTYYVKLLVSDGYTEIAKSAEFTVTADCRTFDGNIDQCNANSCSWYSCGNKCRAAGTPAEQVCPGYCRTFDGNISACNTQGSNGCAWYACVDQCLPTGTDTNSVCGGPTATPTPSVPASCTSLYQTWQQNFGHYCGPNSSLDFNTDGIIDTLDYGVIRQHMDAGDGSWCQQILNTGNFCTTIPPTATPAPTTTAQACQSLYQSWQQYFGRTCGPGSALDFNNDGIIDIRDYGVIRQHMDTNDNSWCQSIINTTGKFCYE